MERDGKGDAVRSRTGAHASCDGRVEEVFAKAGRRDVILDNLRARPFAVELPFDEVRKIDFTDEPPIG
jgi:transcription antitermination factor NusG